jgi:hypothetical protein
LKFLVHLKCIFNCLQPYYAVLQSTGSFFHDKSITLGSLIGVSTILEFSRRSIRGRKTEPLKEKKQSSSKSRIWFFSLCLRDNSTDDAKRVKNPSSLGQFLAVERRAADDYRRNYQNPAITGPDEVLGLAQPFAEPNSLFVDGRIAPPQTGSDMERRKDGGVEHGNGVGVPLLCSCMCGQPSD